MAACDESMHSMAERSLQHEPAACEQGTWMCSTCVHRRCVPAEVVADQIDGRLNSMMCDDRPMAVLVNLHTKVWFQHVSTVPGRGKEAAGT